MKIKNYNIRERSTQIYYEEGYKAMITGISNLYNYKSYYMQVCEDNGRLMIDVGSWSEFFFLEGMNFEEWTNGA